MFDSVSAAHDPTVGEGRLCIRKACGQLAGGDSDFCAAHETRRKDQVRRAVRALRKRRRSQKLCRDCGKRALDSRRCTMCRIKNDRYKKTAVVTRGVIPSSTRIAAATTVSSNSSEEGRSRYHGKSDRGKPQTMTINTDDMLKIKRGWTDADLALALAYAPESNDLPLIQRKEARAAALARLAWVIRFATTTHRRLGGLDEDLLPVDD